MIKNQKIEYYRSYDLGLCAALVSTGFKLASIDKSNPQKVQFVFYKKEGLEDVIDNYWSDRLMIQARSFFDNTKMLKNRIYSE